MRLIDIVLQNPSFWNFWLLSSNPNITMQDLENNKKLPWDYTAVSFNPNIRLEYVQEHLGLPWDWHLLSSVIPISDIMSTQGDDPEYKWSWAGMSSNVTLTEEFLIQNLKHDWNWDVIVANMSLEFIEMNELWLREKVEDYDFWLSFNPNVTLEYTQTFDCDWDNFSDQGNFPFQQVLDNIDLPWSWYHLSKRIDINDIIKSADLQWDWDVISEYNPTITMQIVNDNPELPWNKSLLQLNSGITMKDLSLATQGVEKYFEIDYNNISRNPNLTIDFYLRHKSNFDQINSNGLSKNLWNLKMVKAKKDLLETTIALSGLGFLPPYVIEHITSWSITDPSIDLFDKIKIIDSVLKKKPLR
jgi:hypothetical protein